MQSNRSSDAPGVNRSELSDALESMMEQIRKDMDSALKNATNEIQKMQGQLNNSGHVIGSAHGTERSHDSVSQTKHLDQTATPGSIAQESDPSVPLMHDTSRGRSSIVVQRTSPSHAPSVARRPLQGPDDKKDWLSRVVRNNRFEFITGVCVLINSVFIGVEAQTNCVYHMHPPETVTFWNDVMEIVFMAIFVTEWSLRLIVYKADFFTAEHAYWNMFDTLIIAFQVFEQCLTLILPQHQRFFNTLRMIRAMRIVRIVRLLHLFKEIEVIVVSMTSSFQALLWTIVLMLGLVYGFSVIISQRIAQMSNGHPEARLAYYFPDVPRSALTLLECVLGGLSWDEPVFVLFDEVGWFIASLCIAFIFFGLFVLVNLVTGLFLEQTMQSATLERDKIIAVNLADAFGLNHPDETQLDENEVEQLDVNTFRQKMRAKALQDYFEQIQMKVDDKHIHKFFRLLDADGNGTVSAAELYSGCLKLRGNVRAVDLAFHTQEFRAVTDKLEQQLRVIASQIEARAARCDSRLMTL